MLYILPLMIFFMGSSLFFVIHFKRFEVPIIPTRCRRPIVHVELSKG